MIKKIIQRGLMGIPVGMAIGQLITILISLGWGEGRYLPCVPEFVEMLGNEAWAAAVQAALCAFLGAAFGASSTIWEMESWNLVKQTGIYFGIISVIMMPVAYVCCWMEHSVRGFLRYFGIFAGIFLVIWLLQYLIARRTVKKLNSRLE